MEQILRLAPSRPRPKREWVPTVDYELVARHMAPEAREAYLERSRAWFDAHPRPVRQTAPVPFRPDPEALVKLVAAYGSRIPIEEYRKLGYSEEALARIQAKRNWEVEHSAELQAEIDRRWPGTIKAPKKTVIKAVKKKMT